MVKRYVKEVTSDDLSTLIQPWQILAQEAVSPNVYYEPWMVIPALRWLAIEETPLFLFVYEEAAKEHAPDRLCGFFPVVRKKIGRLPLVIYESWHYIHCFLHTPLIAKGFEEQTIECVLEWIGETSKLPTLLSLKEISGDGHFQTVLSPFLLQRGRGSVTSLHTRPMFRLRSNFDAYMENVFSTRRRKRIAKGRRELAQTGNLHMREFNTWPEAEIAIDQYIELEKNGWKGRSQTAMGSVNHDTDFFRDVVRESGMAGKLFIYGLYLDEKPLAFTINFMAKNGGFAFKTAYDEEYASYSPGILLELDGIEQMFKTSRVDWLDSCTDRGKGHMDHLWLDRTVVQNVLLATDTPSSRAMLSSVPLMKWMRATAGAMVLSKPVEQSE